MAYYDASVLNQIQNPMTVTPTALGESASLWQTIMNEEAINRRRQQLTASTSAPYPLFNPPQQLLAPPQPPQ
jgi:hypothetical protein